MSPGAPWRNTAKISAFRARTSAGSRRRPVRVKRRNARDARQLVILTGLRGSGKSTVLKTFEDLGFYCVDNLPVALIPTFSELHLQAGGEIQRAALLVDAREGGQLEQFPEILRQLRAENPATLVFIEATESALVRRFSETRRPHPLGHD